MGDARTYGSYTRAIGAGLVGGTLQGAVSGYRSGSMIHPVVGAALAAVRAPLQGLGRAATNVAIHTSELYQNKLAGGGRMHGGMSGALASARAKKPSMGRRIKNAQFESKHRRIHGKFT